MTVFGSLGVSWDKLQWLAAALSVGLGFGLQEIFGNFVSGLIILFERPVRIGDTVTIGTFSGTVSKIRIRATTITDFDRKEVIIPNKAFVTERLINWSLSDTVTRVVIRLGVAYGSDLDKVKEVLLKAASEHPKVMHDPAPAVFFTTFGASTLDHELRLYVRELRDRSYTVDELNRSIDRLCRENDINIAFNQLEVHLRNEKGDEHTEVKREIKGDDPHLTLSLEGRGIIWCGLLLLLPSPLRGEGRVRGKFPLKIPPHNLQRLQHRLRRDLMILQQHNQIDGQLDLIGCIFQ